VVTQVVRAELSDIVEMCRHLDGTEPSLPEDWDDVPFEIKVALEREVDDTVGFLKRGVLPVDDLAGVVDATVRVAFLMGRRVGALDRCGISMGSPPLALM